MEPNTTVRTMALVILSGGLDSTCVLAKAVEEYGVDNVEALTFDYRQRHNKEIDCAQRIAVDHYGIPWSPLPLQLPDSVISGQFTGEVPNTTYGQLKGVSPTYVPFRNGNFISQAAAVAASRAQAGNCKYVLMIGTHAEDALNDAYPDCRLDFIGAMAAAIHIGTYGQVRLSAPFIESTKAEIVRSGVTHDAPLNMTWSCYKGENVHCGTCPTCRARKDAFLCSGFTDPTVYRSDEARTTPRDNLYDDDIPF